MSKRTLIISILIVLFGMALFLPGIGKVDLFDWDEINFAESSREMLITGDYLNVQINFESFWEKPPMFIWMQALSMKIFGVNEFAARFPNAVAGILTLLILFCIGRRLKNDKFGLLWAALYAGSFLPFFYFKSGIIDPWFNLFIFLGIYFFSRYVSPSQKSRMMCNAALSAASIGFAILTKGPVALLVFGLTFIVFLALNRFKLNFRWKDVAVFVVVLAIVGGAWFLLQIATGNYSIIQDFIEYQIRLFKTKDAGHGGFFLYHFVILFFGVFPASLFALPAFRRKVLQNEQNGEIANFFRWMMISFWVVLILFTIVKTKIVHYSSFCYFPLTFLAAYIVDKWIEEKQKLPKYIKVLLITIASIFGLILTTLTLFEKIKPAIIPLVKDEYTLNSMKATSEWIGFEPAIGIILIICTILFCIKFGKRSSYANLTILLASTVFYIFSTVLLAVGEVEKYSQTPAIEFYKQRRGEDCYIYPREKSYAHYFYSDRQPANKCADLEFLSRGEIEKPCYFVIKNNKQKIEQFIAPIKNVEKLYELNGFVFYVRYPKDHAE